MKASLSAALLYAVAAVVALDAVPIVVASHKLVPQLKSEVKPGLHAQDPLDVTNMLKKLVTECLSDVYMLLNVPGLQQHDLVDNKLAQWPHLERYLHMASTVAGFPWVDGTVDMPFLEKYIVKTCKAETIQVYESEAEVQQYADVRKRVVKVDLAPLPEAGDERLRALHDTDDLIRKILRKLPSPHYTIIITSDQTLPVHPIPDFALEEFPEQFGVFHSILADPRRDEEVERNNYMYREVEPQWNENLDPMLRYLERKKRDEIHLFDYDLWKKKERLVTTVVLMVFTLFAVQTLSFGRWVKRRFAKEKLA